MTRTPYHSINVFWDTYSNTRPLGFFFFKAEPVSSKLRTHVEKELDRGAESHSQLQIFPFLCATLYLRAGWGGRGGRREEDRKREQEANKV
jgi:hypothetical protein